MLICQGTFHFKDMVQEIKLLLLYAVLVSPLYNKSHYTSLSLFGVQKQDVSIYIFFCNGFPVICIPVRHFRVPMESSFVLVLSSLKLEDIYSEF